MTWIQGNQGPSIFSLQFASKATSVPTAKMYKTARSEPFGALRIRNTPALSTMCSLPHIQILANFGTKTDFDWEICGAESPNSCCSHWRDSHCDPAQIQGFLPHSLRSWPLRAPELQRVAIVLWQLFPKCFQIPHFAGLHNLNTLDPTSNNTKSCISPVHCLFQDILSKPPPLSCQINVLLFK